MHAINTSNVGRHAGAVQLDEPHVICCRPASIMLGGALIWHVLPAATF
jgi:hypothetical protein